MVKTGDVVLVAGSGELLASAVLEDRLLAHGTQGAEQEGKNDPGEHLGGLMVIDVSISERALAKVECSRFQAWVNESWR